MTSANFWSTLSGGTPAGQILWVSVLLLYAEMLAIRWLGMEVLLVRAFPNLILLVMLVGASVGLSRAGKAPGPMWLLLGCSILLILGLTFAVPLGFAHLSVRLDQSSPMAFLSAVAALVFIVVSLTVVSSSIGSKLGAELSKLERLKGYSINLLGSILGVLLFALIGWLHIPPPGWLLMLGIITWLVTRHNVVIISTVVLVGLSCLTTLQSYWSPYSKLDLIPVKDAPNSVLGTGNYILNSNNYFFHCGVRIPDLKSPEVWKRLDQESKESKHTDMLRTYFASVKLSFLTPPNHDRVLVLGGGSGNDADLALKNGAKSVDVVEIDPIIADLGKHAHPTKPYADPRVTLHVEDARTFLRYTNKKFDLIEFAYLDPGATLDSASFLRLDNFVYTVESIKSAIDRLDTNGVGVLSFATGSDSLVTRRLYQVITEAQGRAPLALTSDRAQSAIFFFGPGAKDLKIDPRELDFFRIWPVAGDETETKPATDDWPFLYLDFRNTNGLWFYLSALPVAVLMPLIISMVSRKDQEKISGAAWGNMFFLGQAFMLVEIKSITQLSLLFGATWIVTSVVTLFVLCLAFLANYLASKRKSNSVVPFYICIFVALLVDFFFQIPQRTELHFFGIVGLAALTNCLPIFFGGLIFSTCFRQATSPAAYLSANLLGVAIGGLTENLCMFTGTKSLVLIAMVLYAMSGLVLMIGKKNDISETEPQPQSA